MTIIGAQGRIGRGVAQVAKLLCARIIICDLYQEGELQFFSILGIGQNISKEEAIRQTDILVICASLNEGNVGMISADVLSALPKGAMVINTARGELMDYKALIENIISGHLWGAGLDVIPGEFEEDTFNIRDAIFGLKDTEFRGHNLILTPHIAGSCASARLLTERSMLDNVFSTLEYQR